jgi:hypothetical protein
VTEPVGTKFLLRCVGVHIDPNNLPRVGIEIRVDFGSPCQSYDTKSKGRSKVVALAAVEGIYDRNAGDMASSGLTSVTLTSTPALVVQYPDMAVVNVEFYNIFRGVPLTQFGVDYMTDGNPIEDNILILELTPIE